MARGSPARSLDEQFEPLILEGIGMDTDGAKPCTHVVTGLSGSSRVRAKAKPSREIKA